MMLPITPALLRYIIAEPRPSFWSPLSDGHGTEPNHDNDESLAPMWKLIGRSFAAAVYHIGFQGLLPRSGRPWSCGAVVVLRPRSPRRAMRSISATARSTSHQGTIPMGKRRPPERSW